MFVQDVRTTAAVVEAFQALDMALDMDMALEMQLVSEFFVLILNIKFNVLPPVLQ
jgi:hypothetical protein